MFNTLQETIKNLNADVNNVTNSEKAKKLRKKLLSIGLPMTIGGFLGVFICFILFTIFSINGDGFEFLIPFFLFMPCAAVGGFGAHITTLGLRIIVTGYASNLIKETVGNNCPNCGETFSAEMLFCSKCGTKLKKECSNCKHINNYKNDYCEKCGTKLD